VKSNYIRSALLLLLLATLFASPSLAEVEWRIYKTMKLDAAPVDMAISVNGNWIFTLTEKGTIDIYSPKGELVDKVGVGPHVDQIEAGPLENIVLLKSRENRTVQVLVIDFNQPINIEGAPFKGEADAPIVVAVFSDFQ